MKRQESNAVQLRPLDWGVVFLVMLVAVWAIPRAWSALEGFQPAPGYRIPYALSEDYWHYTRYAGIAARESGVIVAGDSVIWGEYVPPEQTLSGHLAKETPLDFWNLGVNGIHPVALDGLLRYYGRPLRGQRILLHFNPLWMSSPRHDLSTEREFRFNHPRLAPQFWPKIPCYQDSTGARADIVAARHATLRAFASHLAIAYYGNAVPPLWAVDNPYESLLKPLRAGLPGPETSHNPNARPWTERGMAPQPFEWIPPGDSLQWRFFKETALRLRARGNEVFVLTGPFNEHIIAEESKAAYEAILAEAAAWLAAQDFPHYLAPALPSDWYADASHPLGEGYAALARDLLAQPSFRRFLKIDDGKEAKNLQNQRREVL